MKIKVVGIDLAKDIFQVCVLREDGKVQRNRKVRRNKLLHEVRQLPEGTLIAMEACASSHYWARTFKSMGYKTALVPAQLVKPFTRKQKNDANDALAICEAAERPEIHLVEVKTVEQQDIKALRCVRRRIVEHRTAIVNQIRSLSAEYGVIFPLGIKRLRETLPDALADDENGFSRILRSLLSDLLDDLRMLDIDVTALDQQIDQLCKQQPGYSELMSVPGFGPVITSALVSEIGSGGQFANGRQLAAWCGLVPKQQSSGGKQMLGGITKHGNKELRVLLIHGARAVLRFADKRDDRLGRWLRRLIERRGKNKATVALANKLARIAWGVLNSKQHFDARLAFASNT
ncbi:IS110 family transposase [Ferrimonas senticii]|uniref:IS110 family transposase n=1 Tax=Ferrimonas senticii TaxID=394566 RepID=UPI000411AED8|nr:IS110 family transposase [Ferrimonas senticii]